MMSKLRTLGHDEERYRRYRALLAPGTPLREGLERIRAGRTGALIVLGSNPVVDQISTGGFNVNTDFTPTGLRELAKMDGGIVVDKDLTTILAAGVHFTPSLGVSVQPYSSIIRNSTPSGLTVNHCTEKGALYPSS